MRNTRVAPQQARTHLHAVSELAERRHEMATRLSGGQQQILAMGQGVVGDPKLPILDELSGGHPS